MEYHDRPDDIDFQKYWLILKRHWLSATFVWALVAIGAFAFALYADKKYEASGKLRFKKQNTTSALVTEAGEKISTLESLNTKDTPVTTEAEVIQAAPLVNQTIAELDLNDNQGEPIVYESFLESLGVKPLPGTDVLRISYKSTDPEEARQVVDSLMENYLKNNILVNRAEAAAARDFISKQLPKTEAELQRAEATLRQFNEQYNIVALEEESILAVNQIGELNSQIEQINAQVEKVGARIAALENKIGSGSEAALVRNAVSQSPEVQQLREKIQEIDQELVAALSRFREAHPLTIALKNQKTALEERLQQQVNALGAPPQFIASGNLQTGELQNILIENLVSSESEWEGLLEQKQALMQSQAQKRQRANSLPRLKQIQGELERQVNAAQSTYEILLKNLQQVRIAENQNVGNAQIISPAIVSEYPVSMSKKLIVAIGVVVGGVLYVVTAFALELIDPSIKTSNELRNIFNYTLLGMIPSARKKLRWRRVKAEDSTPEVVVRERPNSMIGEAYRMLQANLKFLSPDRKLNAIALTSAVSKEGKSTVAANLAAAIAELGSRVLLIDADLRHPIQHHIWNLTNAKGLSDVIVGQAELHQAIRPVSDNLAVLPSGAIPPSSLTLLSSQRMRSLVEDCRKQYDFVILDTPPLLLVADALTVSKNADGILLVTRPGTLDTASANAAKQLLDRSGQMVLGFVINSVIVEQEPESYFHHAELYYKENAEVEKSQESSRNYQTIQR